MPGLRGDGCADRAQLVRASSWVGRIFRCGRGGRGQLVRASSWVGRLFRWGRVGCNVRPFSSVSQPNYCRLLHGACSVMRLGYSRDAGAACPQHVQVPGLLSATLHQRHCQRRRAPLLWTHARARAPPLAGPCAAAPTAVQAVWLLVSSL